MATEPQPARPRGRPPRNPDGMVRKVAVTQELTNAALEAIARVQPPPTVTSAPTRLIARPLQQDLPVKRKRGRPRKVDQTGPQGQPSRVARDISAPVPSPHVPDSGTNGLPFGLRLVVGGGG